MIQHVTQWVTGIPRTTSDGSGFLQSDRDQNSRAAPRRENLFQPANFSYNLFSISFSHNEQLAKEKWEGFASHMS